MLSARIHALLRHRRTRGITTILVGVLCLMWMIAAVRDWPSAVDKIARTPPLALLLALGLVLGAGVAAMRSWVSVLPDVAKNDRSWGRVFFVGQLGKYMPGSVWAAAFQARLAHDLGGSRRQMVSGFAFAFAISISCAGLLAYSAVEDRWGHPIALVLTFVCLVALCVMTAVACTRRATALTGLRVRPVNIAASAGWSVCGWLLTGAQIAALCIVLGAPPVDALLMCTAATALSVSVGSLAVFTPGGIGVREVLLLHGLSSIIEPSAAAAVVVISRVLYLVADVVLAGGSAILFFRTRTAHEF